MNDQVLKIALQFGAGNIGRGFMGQLFREAGHETWFVDSREELVQRLESAGRYPLRLLDGYSKKEIDLTVDKIRAVSSREQGKIANVFSEASVVGTAVGVRSLEAIAPLIAEGIVRRKYLGGKPVDIYLCENIYGAGDLLREGVFKQLSSEEKEWAEKHIGFVGTSVARMVPAPDKRFEMEGPLFVIADSYHKLPYDDSARRAPTPRIDGMMGVSNFRAEVERKLYTHNLGHAAMGYIGYLKGYTYVHETFMDDFLRQIFEGALEETAEALVKAFPDDIDAEEHRKVLEDVSIRFGNPMLKDSLTRVARDPVRKLGPGDRLIGSARLCLNHGVFPKHIAYVCGAAYCYDFPEDQKAVELQVLIKKLGIDSAVREVSGVDPASTLGKAIIEAYHDLQKKKWTEKNR